MRRGGEQHRVGRVRDVVGLDLLQRVVCHECLDDTGYNQMDKSEGTREQPDLRYGSTEAGVILIRDGSPPIFAARSAYEMVAPSSCGMASNPFHSINTRTAVRWTNWGRNKWIWSSGRVTVLISSVPTWATPIRRGVSVSSETTPARTSCATLLRRSTSASSLSARAEEGIARIVERDHGRSWSGAKRYNGGVGLECQVLTLDRSCKFALGPSIR